MKIKYDARIHKIVDGKIVNKTIAELIEDGMWMYRKTHKGDWERLTPEVCK